MVLTQTSNASDSTSNLNTPLSKSFSFGSIAPAGSSQILAVSLNVPNVRAIDNIQLGLVETGGIVFNNNIFGYTTSVELRDDIIPDSYFQGVNSSKIKANQDTINPYVLPYNIPVKNRDNFNSEYVYLNINLPTYNPIGKGVAKFCWFFDYAD